MQLFGYEKMKLFVPITFTWYLPQRYRFCPKNAQMFNFTPVNLFPLLPASFRLTPGRQKNNRKKQSVLTDNRKKARSGMISKMRKMPDLMDFFWFLCLCVCQFWYCALLEPRSRASPAPTRCLLSKQTPRTYFPILLLIKKNIYKKIFLFLSPNLTNAHMWPAMLAGQPNSGTLAALAAWWLIKQFQPFSDSYFVPF